MASTENIELKFRNGIAFIKVKGELSKLEMVTVAYWLRMQGKRHADFDICADMKHMDIPPLGEPCQKFSRFGKILRTTNTAGKCAVISPSSYVRTVSTIEGAIIPDLDVHVYEPNQRDDALTWLKAA